LTLLSRSSGTESGIVSAMRINYSPGVQNQARIMDRGANRRIYNRRIYESDEHAGILSCSGPCQKSEAWAVVVGDGYCGPKTIAHRGGFGHIGKRLERWQSGLTRTPGK
jgi:hypothetical protein